MTQGQKLLRSNERLNAAIQFLLFALLVLTNVLLWISGKPLLILCIGGIGIMMILQQYGHQAMQASYRERCRAYDEEESLVRLIRRTPIN